jgi:hypothetical protein
MCQVKDTKDKHTKSLQPFICTGIIYQPDPSFLVKPITLPTPQSPSLVYEGDVAAGPVVVITMV